MHLHGLIHALFWPMSLLNVHFPMVRGVSVKKAEMKSMAERESGNSERGFSMIEMVLVVSIILIISAIAIVSMPTSLQNARSDVAVRQLVDQLRQAREYSIANRRYVQVSFATVGTQARVIITQMNALTPGAGANVVLSTVPIQTPMQFTVFAAKGDTPDGYGNANAIEINGINGGPPAGMYFQSDGQFVAAATYLPINGTVFLGVPLNLSTARAVTVMGTTGRVRGWLGGGPTWVQF
jgi:prepilin-type N-terminal cleavage/methylation domain-containing protein